jgi:hypothetical protein
MWPSALGSDSAGTEKSLDYQNICVMVLVIITGGLYAKNYIPHFNLNY